MKNNLQISNGKRLDPVLNRLEMLVRDLIFKFFGKKVNEVTDKTKYLDRLLM